MKKNFLIVALAIFSLTATNAQTATKSKKKATAKVETPKVDGPGMYIAEETIDYGNIAYNSDGNRQFVIVNNGNKPLIITSATGSCGCTVPTAPKEPIAPGARAIIGVKYDTNRPGAFTKQVTVKSNATQGDTKVLTIKGTVLPDTTKAVEPVKS